MSEALSVPRGSGPGRRLALMLGALIVGVVALAAILGPALTPNDPFAQDLGKRLVVPFWMAGGGWEHPLGTDQLGRDYLARLVTGRGSPW